LKLETVIIFGYLSFTAFTQTRLSSWFLPITCAVLFGTLGYFIYREVSIDRRAKRVIKIDSEVTRLKNTFPVSKSWLIGPCILVTIPYILSLTLQIQQGKGLLLASIIAVEAITLCVMYFVAAKTKSRFYSENADVNMALNRVRVRAWTRFWVLASYNAAISGNICFGILLENQFTLIAAVAIVFIMHIVLALWLCGITRTSIKNNANLLLGAPKV
ncbi:MAG: hypothetical protein GXY32_06980, partial [Ruminococcaceae bacterium]|nr:hypothetical protein [Oscillospiraceae bacterium]